MPKIMNEQQPAGEVQKIQKKPFYKKWWFIVIAVLVFLMIVGSFGEDKDKKEAKQDTKEQATHQDEGVKKNVVGEDVKYYDSRFDSMVKVQAYLTKTWIQQGTKYQVAKGTTLADVFKGYKDKGLVNKDARWAVVKDGDRFVVFYYSELDNGNTNSPQWAIQGDEISALNGAAIKYTPELGYDITLSPENKSKDLQLYLKWEELMKTDNWDESKNQINLNRVAKEFEVSSGEADKMFLQGGIEKNQAVSEVNEKRGDILSDERIVQLVKEQGDLYIPD